MDETTGGDMAINWEAEIEKIQGHWTETQGQIEQVEQERDQLVSRYDQQLSQLYTEGVNLNGEARFARRMKDEQEARRAAPETPPAGDTASPDAPSAPAPATVDDAVPDEEATPDTPSPETNDTVGVPSPPEEPAAA
jgi:hypothetical protein